MAKNLPTNAGDVGSVPESGSSPGGGHNNPLQYFCLENPVDRGVGRPRSIGLQRVRHDLATEHALMSVEYNITLNF